MKINQIEISNYLHAADIKLDLQTPITLISGRNGSGKSSIRDAIQHALTGEASRVKLKKEYDMLVNDRLSGSGSGFVEIKSGDSTYSIVIPSGKGNHVDSLTFQYVIDAQRFAKLDEKGRREYLFGLSGVTIKPDSVCKQMIDRGCNAEKVERIKPMLRAGFPAAQKEAEDKARELKGSWKTITGGETWGKDKAEKWEPKLPEMAAEKAGELLSSATSKASEIEAEVKSLTEKLGAAKLFEKSISDSAEEVEKLEKLAGSIDRIKQKIERDTVEAKEIESNLQALKDAQAKKVPDPLLVEIFEVVGELEDHAISSGILFPDDIANRIDACREEYASQYQSENEIDQKELASDILKLESSLKLMCNSVANSKRDLILAEDASKKLAEMSEKTSSQDSPGVNVDQLSALIAEKTKTLNDWNADKTKYQAIIDAHDKRDLTIKQASQFHSDIMEWLAIADQLSPNGIPSELLKNALDPINERLISTASESWMMRGMINDDMSISVTRTRDQATKQTPYALLSESEQWRVDAMIAESISHVSGMKLMVLDRFDVLDVKNRSDLIFWLDGLAQEGAIDTCVILGTLKESPKKLPESFQSYWIENGRVVDIEEVKNKEAA